MLKLLKNQVVTSDNPVRLKKKNSMGKINLRVCIVKSDERGLQIIYRALHFSFLFLLLLIKLKIKVSN